MRLILILTFVFAGALAAKEHPNLILTKADVAQIRSSLGGVPLFDRTYAKVKGEVEYEIAQGIVVPLPRDLAGGFTHERHKANFFNMQKAGLLFQLSGEERYAIYIRDMLLAYAEMFPQFDKHPAQRSYARGKFFWQCLNDANWLVYTSQAYDCIYDWLDKKTVNKLNTELFRPYAEYISIENPQFFNRIHNHSTWGNAAVGMVGMVIGDAELIEWALHGLKGENLKHTGVDNDGGAIKIPDQKEAGFYAQLDHSFSPVGYYTEGPYYQRYAMYPFLIFAQALANEKPEAEIFRYRDGLLLKAVYTLIDLSNSKGEFFPINDAQKGMSLAARELVTAVSMAFYYGGRDKQLLSLIQEQGRVPLNISGLSAATAISEGGAKEYHKKSFLATDGKSGDEGAVGVLRNRKGASTTLVLKYGKHGMGHGHFDRLGFLLYDQGDEVFQDYGSARWVNIEHKDGGGYLKENTSWAKQTVAHNSLVINERSQFDAKVDQADATHGEHLLFDTTQAGIQILSAGEGNAYQDWELTRTMAMIELSDLERPLIIDVLQAHSQADQEVSFHMPLYYVGELMSSNLAFTPMGSLEPMGSNFGYQHLWKEAEATASTDSIFKMTWFNQGKFYSLTSCLQGGDEVIHTRIGANDPEFNLRRDPGLIIKRKAGSTHFVQLYEMHGSYDRSAEIPINSFSAVSYIRVLPSPENYSVIELGLNSGKAYTLALAQDSNGNQINHSLSLAGKELSWTGPYYFFQNNIKESKQ